MKVVDKYTDFVDFRVQFPEFIFDSFTYRYTNNGIIIQYCFLLGDNYQFKPESEISFHDVKWTTQLSDEEVESLVFHIGMIELISYWKASCSPKLIIKPFHLSDEQISWWKKLYFHGLGEFFYLNCIETNVDEFMHIESGEKELKSFRFQPIDPKSVIVPIGGGKDSPVSLEMHHQNGFCVTPLIVNPRGATINTVTAAGLSMNSAITIRRTIDPLLLELNTQGFLNGHTPFSAMLAFYTLLSSRLAGIADIALSNESSANESTVADSDVNHQYSKSFEFESDFRSYYSKFISPDFNYFSFLRPLTELQIAALFAGMPAYHDIFRSCNAGSRHDIWCGQCPKCLFAAIILSPFLSPEKLSEIFDGDMFDKTDLLEELEELTGRVPVKPFECVGTVDEINLALALNVEKNYPDASQAPVLIRTWNAWNHGSVVPNSDWRHAWNPQHYLSSEREKIIKDAL